MNKESFVRLLTYLSIFLCNQSKLSTFAKLVKRVVPFLLRCNLFLIKQELFHVTIIYKTHAFAIAQILKFLVKLTDFNLYTLIISVNETSQRFQFRRSVYKYIDRIAKKKGVLWKPINDVHCTTGGKGQTKIGWLWIKAGFDSNCFWAREN